MSWENDLDRWLTTPPEPEEIPVKECYICNDTLYHLDEVLYDSRIGEHFCDKECFKRYLFKYFNDEADEFIDLLESNRDLETLVLEKG